MIEFIPGNYYFVHSVHGSRLVPVKAVSPVRNLMNGQVGRGIHALTGTAIAVYPKNIAKRTDKLEIATVTGAHINLIF